MKTPKIQVFGSGCPICKSLFATVKSVAGKLNLKAEVEYSDDIAKIVELGVMSSPVFAINNEVIAAGKVPTSEEIEKAICKKLES